MVLLSAIQKHTMMRGIQHICATKGALLEPYVTAIPISSQYSKQHQNTQNAQKLQRLPVPKLEDTLSKYLKSVTPHLNDEELAVTCKLVKEFGEKDGVGQQLQCLLQKRAEKTDNWLEEWWLNTAYLGFREPVVVFSSPGLVFPMRKFINQHEQLQYTAKTIVACMDYKALVDGDKIPQEKMGKFPLDMGQYKKIFGTCRIPCEKLDQLSYNSDSKHITVMHNNHIFRMDLWGDDDVLMSEEQIMNRLKKIIDSSPCRNNKPVGILTSNNRDAWAAAYKALSKCPQNREALCDIERSLAVVCLDAASGLWETQDRMNHAGAQTIHGGGSACNGGNRWFDKTVQFIVGADGVTGLTYEHSPAEGQPIAVLTDFIINFIDQCKTSSSCSQSPKDPVKLDFEVDHEVEQMIKSAEANLDRLAHNLELNCFKYDMYGKGFIKAQKLSPDSYLQMAMQYAFYRLHKKPGAHYESAATRMFLGGRTETIRSCSIESIAFAKTMLDKHCSPKEKLEAMKKAITAHKDYTVQALQGLGVDRHLLGLKLIALENNIELPKLYVDTSFTRSSHMRLSTSQVACKCDGFMCYGPLVPDGYATCYNPREHDINFATSAFCSNPETSCDKYRVALESSLQDMHDVFVKNVCSKL